MPAVGRFLERDALPEAAMVQAASDGSALGQWTGTVFEDVILASLPELVLPGTYFAYDLDNSLTDWWQPGGTFLAYFNYDPTGSCTAIDTPSGMGRNGV